MIAPVFAVERSGNAKLGRASATGASQATCPASCPLLGAGCYAESGRANLTTRRLNQSTESDPNAIALAEAIAIDALPPRRDLRVHVVGDCASMDAASMVGAAMVRYEQRSTTGAKAWTYTHAWRDVPYSAWQGANVLASCETQADIRAARAMGYQRAAIVLAIAEHSSPRAYRVAEDVRILPCPNQTVGVTCTDCRLCLTQDAVKGDLAIGFSVHGARKRVAANSIGGK